MRNMYLVEMSYNPKAFSCQKILDFSDLDVFIYKIVKVTEL